MQVANGPGERDGGSFLEGGLWGRKGRSKEASVVTAVGVDRGWISSSRSSCSVIWQRSGRVGSAKGGRTVPRLASAVLVEAERAYARAGIGRGEEGAIESHGATGTGGCRLRIGRARAPARARVGRGRDGVWACLDGGGIGIVRVVAKDGRHNVGVIGGSHGRSGGSEASSRGRVVLADPASSPRSD